MAIAGLGLVAMLASYQRNQALLTEAPTASEAAPPDSAAARITVVPAGTRSPVR